MQKYVKLKESKSRYTYNPIQQSTILSRNFSEHLNVRLFQRSFTGTLKKASNEISKETSAEDEELLT